MQRGHTNVWAGGVTKKLKNKNKITPIFFFFFFLFCFYFLQGETIYGGQHQIVNMRSNALKLIVLTWNSFGHFRIVYIF